MLVSEYVPNEESQHQQCGMLPLCRAGDESSSRKGDWRDKNRTANIFLHETRSRLSGHSHRKKGRHFREPLQKEFEAGNLA